jgi:hypothetical protein
MHTLLLLLLAMLTVVRLTILVTRERGPFDLAERFREVVLVRYGGGDWRYAGITCPWCVSFWLALPAAAAIWPTLTIPWWLIWIGWWGLAGAAMLILKVLT